MLCNNVIHNEILELNNLQCPFCYEKIDEENEKNDEKNQLCCDKIDIINNNKTFVCKNCGRVDRYDFAPVYIDWYDNMYKIRKKSIYQRKYHLENLLLDFKLSVQSKQQLIKDFNMVETVMSTLFNKKRYIQMKFIIYKLLQIKK